MRTAVLLICLVAAPVLGQWIHLPTPGVPKGKDGKPNLAAPAPRVGGKVDLSGMWTMAEALPCPPIITDDFGECAEKSPIGQPTADLDKIVPGGIPFTPWAIAMRAERKKNGIDPHVLCLPSSFPRMFTLPHVTKFVQTPTMLILMNEFNASYRQIFTDGRKLPDDPQPSWNGYSTAHWDRDTLVVETIGFRDDLWIDMAGTPLTNESRVTERFRRPSFGKIEIEATIADAKAYTKPWTMKLGMKLVLDTELIDEVCMEGERSAQHMKAK